MKTCSPDMRLLALITLTINSYCAFSKITHEVLYVVGCSGNDKTQVQFEFDAEEMLYVDLEKDEVIYTVPRFLDPEPSQLLVGLSILKDALDNKEVCSALLKMCGAEEKYPPQKTDPPESVLYPADDVQLGVENRIVCFVNHFYPPQIEVSWTRNGQQVSEGVSLSRYYPNDEGTFHQFSSLTFTPREGDIYSCTVEHMALDRPKTKIWEPDLSRPGLGPDVFCGVGLALCFLGIAAGTFLIVKGHNDQ